MIQVRAPASVRQLPTQSMKSYQGLPGENKRQQRQALQQSQNPNQSLLLSQDPNQVLSPVQYQQPALGLPLSKCRTKIESGTSSLRPENRPRGGYGCSAQCTIMSVGRGR